MGQEDPLGWMFLLMILGTLCMYYLMMFIYIFMNVAVVGSAGMLLEGIKPSVRGGLRFALSRIWHIIGWTLVTGTVTFIISIITIEGYTGLYSAFRQYA